MLATLATLQLLLAQAPQPREAAPPPEAAVQPANPPLPSKREARAQAPAPRQLSLLSGEALGGGSASLFSAGWSSLGVTYAQGITARDDLGALADLDWVDTELRLGGFYRRSLGRAGGYDVAWRLAATWFRSFGATWVHGKNHSDHGLELGPGLSFSTPTGAGVFSAIVEAPLTITMKYDGGLLFRPRLSVAYEAPLYPDFTMGARLGAGYRAGSGDAPLRQGRGELFFLVVAGYQIL